MKRFIIIALAIAASVMPAFADDYDLLITDLRSIGLVNPGSKANTYNVDLNNNLSIDSSEILDKAGLLKLLFESVQDFPESVQIMLIKLMYSNYNINKELPDIAAFIDKLDLIGSGLSKRGIHPLQESAIYFLPDAAGNSVKTTDLELFPDGTIKLVRVSQNRFFDLLLPDGQKSQPRSVSFDEHGNILELICDDRPIDIVTPDGQAIKAGIVSYNAALKIYSIAKFSEAVPVKVLLSDGQVVVNPRTIVYSDQGKIQLVYASPEKPIPWKFRRGDKIIRRYNSNGWREAVEYFNVEKTVKIIGGIELSEDKEFLKYWQDQIGGYF